jgi:hypothetical protein
MCGKLKNMVLVYLIMTYVVLAIVILFLFSLCICKNNEQLQQWVRNDESYISESKENS